MFAYTYQYTEVLHFCHVFVNIAAGLHCNFTCIEDKSVIPVCAIYLRVGRGSPVIVDERIHWGEGHAAHLGWVIIIV